MGIETENDWWDEISEDEKAEIEQGLAEAESGDILSHEEVMAKYKKFVELTEAQKASIQKGLEEADAGLCVPAEEVTERVRKKYGLNS